MTYGCGDEVLFAHRAEVGDGDQEELVLGIARDVTLAIGGHHEREAPASVSRVIEALTAKHFVSVSDSSRASDKGRDSEGVTDLCVSVGRA